MKIYSLISSTVFCWSAFAVQNAFAADSQGHGGHSASHGDSGHAKSSAGLPQLDASTYPSQLFWLAVTFLFLYLIFSKKTLPEISNVLENRHEHIKNEIDQAERMKKEAESVQKAYEENLIKARETAAKEMDSMHDEMLKKSDEAYQAFLKRSEQEILATEKTLSKVKQEAMNEMNAIAAEVASEAAQKIVGIDMDIEQARSVVESLNVNVKKNNAKAA